jgi:hypothetical protein
MSNLTPQHIVDKNGKHTTVHKNADATTPNSRVLPKPTTPGANKALGVVRKSLKKSGLPSDEVKVVAVARHLSVKTGARDRFGTTVSLIAKTYDVSIQKATDVAQRLFDSIGLGEEVHEVSHSDKMSAAANRILVKNFYTRYGTGETESPAISPAATADVIEATPQPVAEALSEPAQSTAPDEFVAALNAENGKMIDHMNAMLATDNKEALIAISDAIGERNPNDEVGFSYALLRVIESDLSDADKRTAAALVADDYIKFDEQDDFVDYLFTRLG